MNVVRRWHPIVALAAACGLFCPDTAAFGTEATNEPVASAPQTEPGENEADDEDGEADNGESEPDEARQDTSAEVFVPSEDISEDIDVPFPVDI